MNSCLEWNVPESALVMAVQWASRRVQTSVDRKNMPYRSLLQKLDDKIMGDAATQAFMGYLTATERFAVCYEQIRNDHSKNIDPGWDVLSGATEEQFTSLSSNCVPVLSPELVTFSIKSSRVPRGYTLVECMERLDFKILKYGTDIAVDLKADFEVQIYFNNETQPPKDISSVDLDRLIVLARHDLKASKELAQLMQASRFAKAYLCRYISRSALTHRWQLCSEEGLPPVQKMRIGSATKEIWTARLAWGKPFKGVNGCAT